LKGNGKMKISKDVSIAEAIITPNSELHHKTISEPISNINTKQLYLLLKEERDTS
jgi:hypothetical protein